MDIEELEQIVTDFTNSPEKFWGEPNSFYVTGSGYSETVYTRDGWKLTIQQHGRLIKSRWAALWFVIEHPELEHSSSVKVSYSRGFLAHIELCRLDTKAHLRYGIRFDYELGADKCTVTKSSFPYRAFANDGFDESISYQGLLNNSITDALPEWVFAEKAAM